MFVLMTAKELYRSFLADLELIYERSEAAKIISMLFEKNAGISKDELIKNPNQVLKDLISLQLKESMNELKNHKPIQYVLGEAWFYDTKFIVSPAVLIPRPETEELVNIVIKDKRDRGDISVLDIGTGSGCIAIVIKKNIPEALVTAIGVSLIALEIAKKNASIQQTMINFIENNFLDESTWQSLPLFDVIISNPPYIPRNEEKTLGSHVLDHEPHLALFVENERPLIFYEKVCAFGKAHLKKNGKIFLETHEDLAEQTASLFKNNDYSVDIKKDLFEKQRMLIVSRHYP